jgi:hypothetical protein
MTKKKRFMTWAPGEGDAKWLSRFGIDGWEEGVALRNGDREALWG